jgi:hypothetical protein
VKKVLNYFTVGLLAIRIIVWYADDKIKDDLKTIIRSNDDRKLQIDSIRTLRINLEHGDTLKVQTTMVDSLDNRENELILNLKNEERRLLKTSLGQYLDAKEKIKRQLKFLDALESIVNILIVLTIGTLAFNLIKRQ